VNNPGCKGEPWFRRASIFESTCGALFAYLKQWIEHELDCQSDEVDPELVSTSLRELVARAAEQVDPDTSWPSAECVPFEEWELAIDRLQIEVLPDEDWRLEELFLDADPEKVREIKAFHGIEEDYFVQVAPDSDDIQFDDLLNELHHLTSEARGQ
jgi:hypothetical protein